MPTNSLKIGEILIAQGVLNLHQRYAAVNSQHSSGQRLGEILLDQRLITEGDLAVALREQKSCVTKVLQKGRYT